VRDARAGKPGPLYDDMRLYGPDMFVITALATGIETLAKLNATERAWELALATRHPRGYNMRPAGGHGVRRRAVCTIDGCDRPHKGLGYCEKHYYANRLHGDPLDVRGVCAALDCEVITKAGVEWCSKHRPRKRRVRQPSTAVCSVGGCGRVATARGWCMSCYQQWYKRGVARIVPDRKPLALCSVGGCGRGVSSHGLCGCHVQQWTRCGFVVESTGQASMVR